MLTYMHLQYWEAAEIHKSYRHRRGSAELR